MPIASEDQVTQQTQPDQRRLRVLLSAYACEPHYSSEPGVGWYNAQQLSRFHEVWVVTASEHQSAIEAEMARNPNPNLNWLFIDLPSWLTFWKKGERGRRIHYYMFQVAAYQQAKRQHQKTPFDLVHHVTYVSYWTPSFLSRLPAPFIWGPIGGAESAPRSFYSTLTPKGRLYEQIRDAVRWVAHHLDPFVRETAHNTTLAISTTQETYAKLRDLGIAEDKICILSESSLPPEELDELTNLPLPEATEKIKLISLGRMIGWKGFHLGIQAFAKLHEQYPNSEYYMVGGGSELDTWKQLAQDLGVADAIHFTGFIPREEAMAKLADCDVLVHPSLHDSGGWVCLEAMAAGRPVICLNLGGPAVQVTPETGHIVTATNPEQTIDALAAAMLNLAQNPDKRVQMGQAGRQRVLENFDWDKRGEYLTTLYREVHQAELAKQ